MTYLYTDYENYLIVKHKEPEKLQQVINAFCDMKLLSYFSPEPVELWQSSSHPDLILTRWREENWGTAGDIFNRRSCCRRGCEVLMVFSTCEPPLRAYDAGVKLHGFSMEACYKSDRGCGEYIPQRHRQFTDADDIKLFRNMAGTLDWVAPISLETREGVRERCNRCGRSFTGKINPRLW